MTPLEIVLGRIDQSEARVRSAVLLIATLFVLILLFQVSQLDRSWSVVHHALAQRAELWFACRENQTEEACSRMTAGLNDDAITPEVLKKYVDDRLFLKVDAADARRKQQEIYFDNVLRFNIPPLGISVDSHDMIPVAACGFAALLIWLGFCLDNQATALRSFITLAAAKAENRAEWALAAALVVQPITGVLSTESATDQRRAKVLRGLVYAPLALVIWAEAYGFWTGLFYWQVMPKQVILTLCLGTAGTIVMGMATLYVARRLKRMPSFVSFESSANHETKERLSDGQ
jgi:hypothetical protein